MAAGFALAPAGAWAQSVSWADAVEAAWRRSVAAAESSGKRQRAEAGRIVGRSPWAAAPALEIGHRDDRLQSGRGVRESEVAVVWPLWRPGQRAAWRTLSEAELTAAEGQAAAARHGLAGEVQEAAWRVALARLDVSLAEARLASLTSLAADVERRVAAGDLAPADSLAARAETTAVAAELTQARQRRDEASLAWQALTGLSAVPDVGTPPAASPPAEHPLLEAAQRAVEQAQQLVELTEASRADPPELITRLRQDVSGRGEPTSHSFGIALRLPLGTSARDEPRLTHALSERAIARTTERSLRDRLEADLAIARSAEAAEQALLTGAREHASLLRQRSDLIERSFQAGETPLPDTLRAFASAQQAEAAARRHEITLGLAQARVLHALGATP